MTARAERALHPGGRTADIPRVTDVMPAAAAATDAVVVRFGTGRFGVDLTSVAEVGRVPAITRVPGVPDWLTGVANWRGRILPVLDLRPLVGGEPAPLTAQARLLVVAAHEMSVGLLVDRVDGIDALAGQVEVCPAALTGVAADLLAGQVPRPDGPIAVLDVAAVVALRDRLARGRRPG